MNLFLTILRSSGVEIKGVCGRTSPTLGVGVCVRERERQRKCEQPREVWPRVRK